MIVFFLYQTYIYTEIDYPKYHYNNELKIFYVIVLFLMFIYISLFKTYLDLGNAPQHQAIGPLLRADFVDFLH